ncbi:hypothetical protein ACSBM8_10340 [Sphingomonas sp. ASY06-1R]|jgi:hypothetical protein|uniref:hypothetical protein n=1 Tax=Sphingomonas sp. ASY06-1R TaxID=3445771 RepID=UPI003FA1E063
MAMPPQVFPYYRSIAPTLTMLLGLAIAETVVVHLIAAALWGMKVAILLGVIDLSFVIALVGLLHAIRTRPVTLEGGVLTMRMGRMILLNIPVSQIAGFRETWDAPFLKRRDVRNMALAAWPNIVIDLAAPIRSGRRDVVAVAHRIDDAAALRVALTRAMSGA